MKQLLRYLFVVAAMLMVVVGNVWGQTCKDGTWYSLYDGETKSNTTAGTTFCEKAVFAPAESMTFEYIKFTLGSINGNLEVQNKVNGSWSGSKGSVSYSDHKNWKTSGTINLDPNISHIRYKMSGTGAKVRNHFVKLKKHILLESGTYGTSSITVTDGNLATAEGYTSTNAYKIKLRSFLASGNIKMTSSNPEFHFGGGVTEVYLGVDNNYCASANGSGTCTNVSTLGHISSYYKDVYFSPSVQYNTNTRSTTITITDGVNTAYVYLTAPVIPTYYFKAEAVASPAGGGSVSATFANGQSTYSVVASSYTALSASADVTFSMNGCAANHVFEGWKANPADANYLDGLQGAEKTSFTRTITSSELDPRSLDSQLTFYAIFSSRFTATITGSNYVDKLVGESFPADYNFISTQTEKPSASAADPFYFVIDHNFDGNDTREGSPRPDEVIAYDPENNTITPLNEGTATITFYQKNTDSHNPVSKSFTVKVIKHTPSFALKSDPLYFNKEYPDYFTTTADSRLTITSSDTLVAKWVPGSNSQSYTLKTFSKTNTATLTAIQYENYYWNRWEGSVDIQLQNARNHVPLKIESETDMRSLWVSNTHNLTWDGGVDLQGGDYADKFYVFKFEGYPKEITFKYKVNSGATTYEYWSVEQSDSNGNWGNATKWVKDGGESGEGSLQLNENTRYIRLCYSGNGHGLFYDISVSRLEEFYAAKPDTETPITELNFNKDANGDDKENQVNAPYSLSFDFHYANIGHDVNLSTNDPAHFTISQTSFKDLGGEQVGKRTITVTYSSPTEYNVEKELYITDELGNTIVIPLIAATVKATQTLTWQGVYAAEKPVVRISEGAVSGLATASSGLQVTYRSSDESIIKVSEDSLSLIPLQVAEAVEITAVQKGNNVWNEVKETKTFRVTDKKTQLIHWPNTLSDLVIGGANVNLDAKVYIVDDITGEYTYSAERTANLQYTVENTNVVDIEDGVLKIKSVGNTYLTVTSPGDEQFAEASIKEYVRVRTVSAGCEDNLLHVSHTDSELEFFRMNLSAIQHGPFDIDRTLGEPDYITLQHRGVAWGASFSGEIEVLYATEVGSGDLTSAGKFSPTKNQTNVATIDLPRNAVQFYIKRLYGGTGYHYISNIKVYPDQFIETNVASIDFGNIYVGSQVTQSFTVNYCNIKSEIYPQTSSADVQVSPSSFGECNGYGSQSITVTWTPSAVSKKEQTVTIADPVSGKSASVRIYANVFKGTQTLNWVAPSPIKACGELPLPEETNEHIALEWAVVAGDAYADFEDGYLALKGNGTITLRASNQGSENYNEFQKDYQITIVYNPIFLGTVDSVWTNPANWNICHVPTAAELQGRILEIQAPVALTEELSVAGIVLQNNATIHIADTGGLSIGAQGIRGTNNDGTSIIIDNTPTGAGYFRMDSTAQYKPAKATVNYTTKTYDQGYPRYEVWQYIGMPGENAHMEGLNSEVSIYNWDETCGWLKQDYTPETNIPAWTGYAFTQSQEENATFTIKAEPIFAGKEISFTCTASGMRGDNLLVNSYLAPIDITKIEPEDVIDSQNKLTKTFFFFNAGSWSDWKDGAGDITANGYDQSSAGHYYSVPFYSSRLMKSGDTQLVIPSMQGVYVYTEAPSSIKLNYTKHVYGADAANNLNQPMRAPEQKLSDNFRRVCIQAGSENSGADRMYVIQDESTTPDYDNGYDGDNIIASGQVNIYTSEHFGQMEVSCSNDIDSMYIGFTAGEDSEYMLNFSAVVGDDLYLYDTDADLLLPLIDGEQYAFYAAPNSVNNSRFLIIKKSTSNPDDGQGGVATDVENLPTGQNLCIHNNIVYVSEAPANSSLSVYATNGALLAGPYTINHAPYTLKLDLPAGVYMLRLNNHVYKFVCQ